MSRSSKVNITLFGLILLLAGMAWYSLEQEQTSSNILLTKLQPEQVTSISIENSSGPAFTMERNGDNWIMTRPYQVAANSSRIARLLEITRSLSVSRFKSPGDLDAYGLASPKATLQLNNHKILAGNTHPMNQRRYLLYADQVHLINDRFIHHFKARAEEFIDHKLIPGNASISTIKTPIWNIKREADGTFSLSPKEQDLSQDQLNKKLDNWKSAFANKIAPAPEQQGSWVLEITPTGEKTISFEVHPGEKRTMLVRRELGIAYLIPSKSQLLEPPAGAE